jgi:drug/metabolite transporter (DMT)-like permease
MTVGLGLGAAVAFALSDMLNKPVTRQMSPTAAVAWVLAVALAPMLVLAVFVSGSSVPLAPIEHAAVAGVMNVCALMCLFRALACGRLAVVAPLIALDGAFAALAAMLLGEQLAPLAYAGLVLAVAGTLLASGALPSRLNHPGAESGRPPVDETNCKAGRTEVRWDALSAGWALLGAGCFAASYLLYGTGGALPAVTWVATSMGAGLVALLAAALLARVPLALPRSARSRVIGSGLLQATGCLAMVTALIRGPVSVAAVVLGQVATVGVLLGAVVLRERLARTQWIGVVFVVGASTLLAAAGGGS